MDWTIPYTFYPTALPNWLAWVLFAAAILSGIARARVVLRRSNWTRAIGAGVAVATLALMTSVVVSAMATFLFFDA